MGVIDDQVLGEVLGSDFRRFDKGGDVFYEQISALHKAVRGSSPDAALYWLARMLDGWLRPLCILLAASSGWQVKTLAMPTPGRLRYV